MGVIYSYRSPSNINATTGLDLSDTTLDANVLSNGSAFMLLTTLLTAIVFHPFGGSLVYGPSERFWLASPIAVFLEVGVIWKRLAGQLLPGLLKTQRMPGLSKQFSIRHAAFAVIAARMMNTRKGHSKRQALREDDKEAVLDTAYDDFEEITEGYRFRITIVFPIVAQYIKISVVEGPHTTFLRVLGTLYLVHWITLECLISLARRPSDDDLIAQLHKLLPNENASSATMPQNRDTTDHRGDDTIWEISMFCLHLLLFWFAAPVLGLFKPSSEKNPGIVVSASIRVISMTVHTSVSPVPMLFASAAPAVWLVYRGWRLVMLFLPKGATDNDSRQQSRRQSRWRLRSYPSSIGGEIGTICFMYWIIYCGFIYDASNTSRPDWPWLDWLG